MSKTYKLLSINPGSTSTKIAVFENEKRLFQKDVVHSAERLAGFKEIVDQYEYRKEAILEVLAEAGYDPADMDAYAGRGGGGLSCEGGTYPVNAAMLAGVRNSKIRHPATLGPVLVHELSQTYGKPAFVVNPPDVDEMEDVARVGGLVEAPRGSRFHALNQKEAALRAAADMGRRYEEVNFVVAHLGGGISVGAHRRGKVVDVSDIVNGDCPMAPTRAGAVSPGAVIALCFSGEYTEKEMKDKVLKNGGMVDHLGTSDILEVKKRIAAGDAYARLVYEALAYQVGKSIGSFVAALNGKVDAIVLTGGIARDHDFVEALRGMVGSMAPVKVYPGEFEMEALANGALRVLRGEEKPKTFTGVPIWTGFEKYKRE